MVTFLYGFLNNVCSVYSIGYSLSMLYVLTSSWIGVACPVFYRQTVPLGTLKLWVSLIKVCSADLFRRCPESGVQTQTKKWYIQTLFLSFSVFYRQTVPSGDPNVWFCTGSLGRCQWSGKGHITSGLDAQLHRGTVASTEAKPWRRRRPWRPRRQHWWPIASGLSALRSALPIDASSPTGSIASGSNGKTGP